MVKVGRIGRIGRIGALESRFGGAIAIPRLINLPPPDWFGAGYEAYRVGGAQQQYVISNGTNYLDRNGDVVSDWWRPGGAVLHVDFANSRFYWNGTVKALGDLTAIGDGSYTLAWSSVGATWTGDYSWQLETNLASATTADTFGGWLNSGAVYQLLRARGAATPTRRWASVVSRPTSITETTVEARNADAQLDGLTTFAGVNRSAFAVGSDESTRAIWSNGFLNTHASTNGTITAPVTLHFGRNPGSGAVSAGVEDRVYTLWTSALSTDDLRLANDLSLSRPIHMLGDSFLTNGNLLMAFKAAIDGDAIVGYSQDGVGSTTLEDQLSRLSTTPHVYKSCLVIMDGSNELTAAESIAAIQAMAALLPHNDWVYVQPNPINPDGDSRRTQWNADQTAIEAAIGSNHYCETLTGMQAASDGSAGDLARLADDLWPLSQCTDGTHPSDPDGYATLAAIIKARLEALGMLKTSAG